VSAFDVCVIGGGPAGSALALRLAHLGRRVALIEKTYFRERHLPESLVGGILPLLDALNVRTDVESSAIRSGLWTTVKWSGRSDHRYSPSGYLVHRSHFDSLLLCAASRSGVVVKHPARLTKCAFDGHWCLELDSGEVLRAQYLADAAGRSRVLGGTKLGMGVPTVALSACWRGVKTEDTSMLVEAGTSEWYWGAPIPGGMFHATVFLGTKRALKSRYRELIDKSSLFSHRLRQAVCGDVHACDATPYVDQNPITNCSVKAGDAAVSIDPLSSQGVQTAIGTALHAAVALNTMIGRPNNSVIAMQFYRKRVQDSAEFHRLASGQLYREHYETVGSEFWEKRSKTVALNQPSRRELLLDRAIRIADRVSFVPVPTVLNQYVVPTSGVELDGRLYANVGGINVADLLRTINQSTIATKVINHWSRLIPVSVAAEILQWVWREGLVEMVS
jgi:flavin-dependent dehydrogenase